MKRIVYTTTVLAAAAFLGGFMVPAVADQPTTWVAPAPTVGPLPPTDDILDPADFAPAPTAEPEPTEAPQPPPAPEPDPPPPTKNAAATTPEPAPPPAPKPEVVELAPITAFQDQAAVDTGALVTYIDPARFGFCLIAGHDFSGWYWLDDLAVGTVVRVTQGPCAGEYEVVGHEWQETKGGQHPEWMHDYDLILQTCTGATGTGFSLLVRR